MRPEEWDHWVAQREGAMSESAVAREDHASDHALKHFANFQRLPAELREGIWRSAIRDALNEAARSLPDVLVREIGFDAEDYHQYGCRCHAFWRCLRPILAVCVESRAAVARYTKMLMEGAGRGEDGGIF